jgi:hypothetical protein
MVSSDDMKRLGDLLASRLTETAPFGISNFNRSYDSKSLVGSLVRFRGAGADGRSFLVVELVPWSGREGAVDAMPCWIERGEKQIFMSHFLASKKRPDSVFSNVQKLNMEKFIDSVVSELASLDQFDELRGALGGSSWVDVPFDWQGAR